MRLLWMKQIVILDHIDGLSYRASGIRVTYTNLIQVSIIRPLHQNNWWVKIDDQMTNSSTTNLKNISHHQLFIWMTSLFVLALKSDNWLGQMNYTTTWRDRTIETSSRHAKKVPVPRIGFLMKIASTGTIALCLSVTPNNMTINIDYWTSVLSTFCEIWCRRNHPDISTNSRVIPLEVFLDPWRFWENPDVPGTVSYMFPLPISSYAEPTKCGFHWASSTGGGPSTT